MASSPITSWHTEGEKVEVVTNFLSSSSKISADGECNHEIRRQLLLGSIAMTNLDSMLKSRDITPLTSPYSPGCGLPSGHVRLRELDRKEGGAPKNDAF